MAILIEVQLLAGRYHGHVWGEAQFAMAGPEWPPSPWRLLRALASVWFATQPAPSTEAERDALLKALGNSGAPELWLPATSFHEVRYYQPLEQKRALHHDFFAVPLEGRFYFLLDADLSPNQRRLLDSLLPRLRYFGRGESRATLGTRDDLVGPPRNFHRVLPRERTDSCVDSVLRRTLCPSKERKFRASDLWTTRSEEKPTKKRKKKNEAQSVGVPLHLVDTLINERKPLPDGAEWVEYVQPARSIVYEHARLPRSPSQGTTAVQIRSVSLRLCRRIPIPLAQTVAVARAYRDAVVYLYRDATGGKHSLTLTGRQQEDGPVDRGHQHLYYLPQPGVHTSHITRLIVRVPVNVLLCSEELDALLSVQRIALAAHDRYPITIVPEWMSGDIPHAPSRVWRSVTPFLTPRGHRSGRGATTPEFQLARYLEQSCGFAPARWQRERGPAGTGERTSVRTHEYGVAVDGSPTWRLTRRLGYWFTVEFNEPVILDVPMGTDSHFGLGQFMPLFDDSTEGG